MASSEAKAILRSPIGLGALSWSIARCSEKFAIAHSANAVTPALFTVSLPSGRLALVSGGALA
jgi:hypothetical protein